MILMQFLVEAITLCLVGGAIGLGIGYALIVALKMILAGQFASQQIIQRFRGEVTAAALLQHPNITGICYFHYAIDREGPCYPLRVFWRDAEDSRLRPLIRGHLIADVVALIGSLDVVLGEVDR